MIRVGIMSMQRIANYGSFLQAYGLKHILEELGCEVQFVDYHPGVTLIPAVGGTGLKRKVRKVLDTFKCNAPLKEKIRFINYKRNYATNYYPLLGITAEKNYAPVIDLLVIGSDEVFNCVQNNTNVGFSADLFGHGSNARNKISYAASFGNTTIEMLRKYDVDKSVGSWINELDAVSVRDKNSAKIVEELTGQNPTEHLDPVLIYEFMESGMVPKHVDEQNYMLLYGYSGRFSTTECTLIRKYADKNKLKIFCIGGVQDCCDKYIDCDPFKVITYFKNANCIVTDTFHGSVLSIITHCQFVSVIRNSGYGNSEKLIDLLRKLGLENRQISVMDQLDKILCKPIDYETVDIIIKSERKRTREYLSIWV